nr:reverse transcriptase domain-containing protein [Tanacetum cinerariifolium]
MHQEKVQQEKLKAVKARLNFEEASQYSESETLNRRRNLKERLGPRLGDKEKNVSAHSRGSERKSYYSSRRDTESYYQSSRSKETETAFEKHHHKREYSRRTEAVSESEGSAGGHWETKPKKQKSSMEDDLPQPWESIPGKLPPTEKMHQRSGRNPQHQAKKWGSMKEFVRRYKLECRDVKGAPECMKISGFMHGITNPELIKRLHDKIHKSMDEMMSVTTAQIEEMLKPGKLSHLIKELKQNHGKDQAKIAKIGETLGKDKPLAILMVQPWQRIARKRITQTFSPESVISFPTLGEEDGTKGPMIIEAEIGGHCVHRIYVDKGSSSEILYEHCFSKFRSEIKNQLIPANTLLVGFNGEIIWPLGSPSPYNGIIGRPGVRKIRAIPSTAHGMIKFPMAGEIVTLQSSRIIPLECSMVLEPGVPRSAVNLVREEKIQVAIHSEYLKQTIAIGFTLTEEGRKELCGLLRRHLDVFAWKPTNMTGVPQHIAEHRLNVRKGCLPIRQKKRGQVPERNKAISEEIKKLVEADIMKEVHYHSWLSNPLMIKMADEDEEKTAFITSQGIFCYSKMPFGLKNTRATYQRLVDRNFQKQIGRNLEKNKYEIKPKKCAFGMREGTFLGYKVDADELRVSPDKIKAVLDLPSPKCLKDVQKLNGKLVSLNRFLSKSVEKFLPFFKTLKKCTKKSDFQWTPEAEGAFKEMKQSIAELSMLTAPKEKEELNMYLAATKEAISAILMTERDGKQVHVYFVSRALQGLEFNYIPMEKLILALDDAPDTPIEDREELPDPWILFTDGSLCIDGFGAVLIITNPEGMEFTYAIRFRFNATNNEAEYEALIASLRIARQIGVQNLQANVDSKLVANQVNKIYIAKESSMIRYLKKVKNLANTFKGFSIKQIPRGENKKADALSKITTSTSFAHLSKQVLVEELREKVIDEKEIIAVVEEEGHTWMTLVYEYLTEGILPEEKKKARTVRRKARRYAVINEVLHKKSFLGPWLRCVGPLQANYVLREIHKGSCSMHAGPRSVVAKALSKASGNHTGTRVKKFIWDNILCIFGLPGEIVSDNGEHDIQYRPRTSVKGQILADFIVERPEDDTPDTSMEDREDLLDPWILFTDGSSCIDEYEALIAGLRIAK